MTPWVAYCEDQFADAKPGRIACGDRGQVFGRNFKHRDIHLWIAVNHLRIEDALVGQMYLDGCLIIRDDVVIRDDSAIGAPDDTCTCSTS